MVEDEEYVIIFGNSHYGRSTLLKRLIIEEGGVFFLLSKSLTDPMDESMHLLYLVILSMIEWLVAVYSNF